MKRIIIAAISLNVLFGVAAFSAQPPPEAPLKSELIVMEPMEFVATAPAVQVFEFEPEIIVAALPAE